MFEQRMYLESRRWHNFPIQWMDAVKGRDVVIWDGDRVERTYLGENGDQELCFVCVRFKAPVRYPSGNLERTAGYTSLEFKKEVYIL